MANHQNRALLVALAGGIAGAIGGGAAYLLLGAATGVVAMCAWAPAWWVHVYFFLAVVVPACAMWLAIAWRRSYLRRHEEAGA